MLKEIKKFELNLYKVDSNLDSSYYSIKPPPIISNILRELKHLTDRQTFSECVQSLPLL